MNIYTVSMDIQLDAYETNSVRMHLWLMIYCCGHLQLHRNGHCSSITCPFSKSFQSSISGLKLISIIY